MTTTELSRSNKASLGAAVRQAIGGRRSLIAAAVAVAVAGIAFNWTWLVAAGIAPLLISVLPCVGMCALGLCMNRMTGGASGPQPPAGEPEETGPLRLAASSDRSGVSEPVASAAAGSARAAGKSCCHSAR